MSENRRWNRVKPSGLVPRTGTLMLDPKAKPITCQIIDLSVGGACLELSDTYAFPERFEFIHGRTRRFCKLAWRRGFCIGISYEVTNRRTVVEGGLSRPTSGLSRLSRDRR